MRYSVQPRHWIFVKDYGILSFARNIGKNFGKNVINNLSSKYSKKLLDHAKKSATNALKTNSKGAIQKISETTGDVCENEIADKVTRASKISPKNNSETNEEEILRERFLPPELRHKIINDLRLKEKSYWKLFVDLKLI